MLVSSHLPYRHDNLGVGSMPGVHYYRAKSHPLLAGSEGRREGGREEMEEGGGEGEEGGEDVGEAE
jgi:hypothetical protein